MRLIKNFIYNFSDIFIALIIIALAALLIWTRVDNIMTYPEQLHAQQATAVEQKSDAEVEEKYITISIPENTSTEDLAALLKEQNIITDTNYFMSQIHSMGVDGQIEAGEYKVPKGSSISELITTLCKDNINSTTAPAPAEQTNYKEISIPKDSSTEVVAGLLKQANIITETNYFTSQIRSMGLEGKIEAGVYQIPKGCNMETLINILCKQTGESSEADTE